VVGLIISNFSLSILLIHLLAYAYGSMQRDHLLDFYYIIAFSIENESIGKPKIPHYRIVTALPRISLRLNFSEQGIIKSLHFLTQSFIILDL